MTEKQLIWDDPVIREERNELFRRRLPWEELIDRRILVTGATGMLASFLAGMLIYLNKEHGYGMRLVLLARSREKLVNRFGNESEEVRFLVQDVCDRIVTAGELDFIIHAAGAANPQSIVSDPVGIVRANTLGTMNVLELARKSGMPAVLFTSTREVYGMVEGRERISENDMGITDPLDSRSCYPESKRLAETMLASYALQYGVPFNTLRIAHVYGPGMQIHNDNRVMADFLRDAVEKRDITLNSDGSAIRSFCYITDAADAIFRVMTGGANGEAYNIANENEPVSVRELAHTIQDLAGNGKRILIKGGAVPGAGYARYERVALDTSKISALGWEPVVSLRQGIARTLQHLEYREAGKKGHQS